MRSTSVIRGASAAAASLFLAGAVLAQPAAPSAGVYTAPDRDFVATVMAAQQAGQLLGMSSTLPAVDAQALEEWRAANPAVTLTRSLPGWEAEIAATQWHLAALGAQQAWTVSDGTGVTIAVMDTGINSAHPDLASQLSPTAVIAYKDRATTTPISLMRDTDSHGTHVAGIAAASNDGVGMTGVAPGAKIMPIKFTDGSYSEGAFDDPERLVGALQAAAAAGAGVVNMSFGREVEPGQDINSQPICKALASVADLDLVIVVAAGNTGTAANLPHVPAACPDVLSVGALDGNLEPAAFSTYNEYVDVSAPGVKIASTLPGLYGSYGALSGTSMATPMVAGVAAMVRAAHPDWTAEQVIQQIIDTSRDIGAPGFDPRTGAGVVDAAAALGLPATPAPTAAGLDVTITADKVTWLPPKNGAEAYKLRIATPARGDSEAAMFPDMELPGSATSVTLPSTLPSGSVILMDAIGVDGTVSRAMGIVGTLVEGAPPSDLKVKSTDRGRVSATWTNPPGTVFVMVTTAKDGQMAEVTTYSAELGQALPHSISIPGATKAGQNVFVSVSAGTADGTAGEASVTIKVPRPRSAAAQGVSSQNPGH